jgi:hypothetical protein
VSDIEDIWEIRYPDAVQCIDCNQSLTISCQTETQCLLLLTKQNLRRFLMFILLGIGRLYDELLDPLSSQLVIG